MNNSFLQVEPSFVKLKGIYIDPDYFFSFRILLKRERFIKKLKFTSIGWAQLNEKVEIEEEKEYVAT